MNPSKLTPHSVASIVLAAAVFAASSAARASYPQGWTDAELALTPPYCQDVQTLRYGDKYSPSPNAAKWVALMGEGFWAVHHYCWALINLGRADRPSMPAQERLGLRMGAVADMMYVIRNTPPNFILLPEIYTRKGQVELLLKRDADAKASFEKARELKPDYWPAYFQWAEYLANSGQKSQAREVLVEGLRHAPSSKTLRKYYRDLGGDPSDVRAPGDSTPDKAAAK
jgi:tetratricopeptide (TPR) repeat protein